MQNRTFGSKIKEMLLSRKFWLMVILVALAITLFVQGAIDTTAMITVITVATAVYIGSLGLEDAARQLYPILGPVVRELLNKRGGGGSSTGA